ncbi:hypothetical protein POM88_036268 [Heracleum sosnowskyi]|uniref:Uncharacterized protein n=1 Tax=Heracleum sosnowskyi TaxID=360622 RepID=A0AAD8HN29_9APIA|nr:hypothetical protein POM88_036268 [Heracleum sosnowskyi]
MDDSFGHGDDLIWDGLACPPLEDYVFNFHSNFKPDDELAVSIKSGEKTRRKPTTVTRPCGKGKEIKILAQVLEVEMHSKTFYGYHSVDFKKRKAGHDLKFKGGVTKKRVQGSGAKDMTMLDHTNGLAVNNKRKAEQLDVVDRTVIMNQNLKLQGTSSTRTTSELKRLKDKKRFKSPTFKYQ